MVMVVGSLRCTIFLSGFCDKQTYRLVHRMCRLTHPSCSKYYNERYSVTCVTLFSVYLHLIALVLHFPTNNVYNQQLPIFYAFQFNQKLVTRSHNYHISQKEKGKQICRQKVSLREIKIRLDIPGLCLLSSELSSITFLTCNSPSGYIYTNKRVSIVRNTRVCMYVLILLSIHVCTFKLVR